MVGPIQMDRLKSCGPLLGCNTARRDEIAMNVEELAKEFQAFAMQAAEFSQRVSDPTLKAEKNKSRLAESNLEIARTIFGKWSIEIFVILYNLGPVGFEGLRKGLGDITPRVLSQKLRRMETEGLVRRTLIDSRPPGVRYSLTQKGVTVAMLGTPVFLFLNFDKQPS